MAMMFDYYNFLVMSVHVAVMITILLDHRYPQLSPKR